MKSDPYARSGRIMFILAWLVFFVVLILFFHAYQQRQQSSYSIQQGKLILKADRQGHYQVPGTIEGHPVKFMLDTGATLVAIPKNMATRMALKGRYPVNIQTANGQITGLLTRLDELTFGGFTVKDVKAVIIPGAHDDTVLMGMNVLSQFNWVLENKQLIIKRE